MVRVLFHLKNCFTLKKVLDCNSIENEKSIHPFFYIESGGETTSSVPIDQMYRFFVRLFLGDKLLEISGLRRFQRLTTYSTGLRMFLAGNDSFPIRNSRTKNLLYIWSNGT